MRKRIKMILAAAGIVTAFAISPAVARPTQDSKMSDGSGSKMSHQQMMDKMDKLTADDKAAMYDRMSNRDKMAAMKMSGHDMNKMSHKESMDMMGKMSTEDKAGAFDKMPMEKRMTMMRMHKDSKMMNK